MTLGSQLVQWHAARCREVQRPKLQNGRVRRGRETGQSGPAQSRDGLRGWTGWLDGPAPAALHFAPKRGPRRQPGEPWESQGGAHLNELKAQWPIRGWRSVEVPALAPIQVSAPTEASEATPFGTPAACQPRPGALICSSLQMARAAGAPDMSRASP